MNPSLPENPQSTDTQTAEPVVLSPQPPTSSINDSPTVQAQSIQPKSYKKLALVGLTIVALAVGVSAAYMLTNKKTPVPKARQTSSPKANSVQPTASNTNANQPATSSLTYEDIINQFIKAIQNQDKKTADSLESPVLQASVKKDSGTTSFYAACYQAGVTCTGLYSSSYLSSGTKTNKPYTSANVTPGQEIIYTIKQSSDNGQGGSSTSTTSVRLAAVQKNNLWLVDFVDASGDSNASFDPGTVSN